jgi:hypothetical protein
VENRSATVSTAVACDEALKYNGGKLYRAFPTVSATRVNGSRREFGVWCPAALVRTRGVLERLFGEGTPMTRHIAASVIVLLFLMLTSFAAGQAVKVTSISFCEQVSDDGTIPINVTSRFGGDAPSEEMRAAGQAEQQRKTAEAKATHVSKGSDNQTAQKPPVKDAKTALLGIWQCRMPTGTATLVFESANHLSLDGSPASYSVVQNALRVTDDDGTQDYPYTLKDNVLTISFPEGYQLQFTRVSDKTKYTAEDNPPAGETDAGAYSEDKPAGEEGTDEETYGQVPGGRQTYGGGATGGDMDLMNHFAGTWWNATTNTETNLTLTADGRYFESYTASYSGGSSDQYGNTDMTWGTAGDQQAQGTWTVRGTREQGVLTIIFQDGTRREINYQVHVENGEVYWSEYYFNGELYGKK